MKKILFFIFFSVGITPLFATHISGGEMSYIYIGPGTNPGTLKYSVTLRMYKDCNTGGADLENLVTFTVFNTATNVQIRNIQNIQGSPLLTLQKIPNDPCIPDNIEQLVCFFTRTYTTEIDNLPVSSSGYTVTYQRCCRVAGMQNITSTNVGISYFAKIPGNFIPGAETNSSPVFNTFDTVLICSGKPFNFDFSSVDTDGDLLQYSFYNAFSGGGPTTQPSNCLSCTAPDPSAAPPYIPVNYINGYSSVFPLGSGVNINANTGLISGIAPNLGVGINRIFAITVLVSEYRNNIKIAEHFKDLQIRVSDCQATVAQLNPKPTTCDGFIVSFQNDAFNDPPPTYLWIFGDPASGSLDTSRLPNPTHDYTLAGAGDYRVKLYLNLAEPCSDSAEVTIKVYPGFRPAFEVLGQCKNTPMQFNDLSQHDFGTINKWTWNFDDPSSGVNNTSILKNPTHVFANSGIYNVTLLVESDKGCSALIPKQVEVKDKPAFTVFPKDTLICKIDDLQISATGSGTVVWSPNYNISNVNIPNPIVSPDVTTTYTATFTDAFGCSGTDNAKINVVDRVLQGNDYDTTICTGDALQLRLFSNALYYTWTPNDGSLNSTTIKNPTATPTNVTDYVVVGKISNICFAQNTIRVRPVPYPTVVAPDVSVCFGRSTQLQASGGTIYNWSPRTYLNSTTIPNPTVTSPVTSVLYTLTVRDVLGCPKPVQKLVKLNVVKIKANAGPRDTSVVLGQPLQLFATGGTNFLWLPDNRWLSRTDVNNPIALPQSDIEYIVQVSDANGCKGLDSIRVKLYKVVPGLYVPNAFTPNGDSKNDIFRPVLLGMKSLDLFQVYNRFGQMIYSGTDITKGWDGTFGGRPQDPSNFVWVAEATDYTGKKIKRKGNVILIRQ
jgi:gliding motility-associated-like protein